ncbi:MAG: hypothetical protein IT340_19975 [Chloroflexi bacterium]|nr:hypothetical protein [Chloroflexota bacterium]
MVAPPGFTRHGARLRQMLDVSLPQPAATVATPLVYDTVAGRWKATALPTAGLADEAVTYVKLAADVLAGLDPRYVNTAGDTMTGALTNSSGYYANRAGGTAFVAMTGALGATVSDGGSLTFQKTRSSDPATHTILADLDSMGSIYWGGSDGAAFVLGARIRGRVDGTPASGEMPGYLDFSTTAGANSDGESTSLPTERMRITRTGFVGVNVTAPAAQVDVLTKRVGTVGLRVRAQASPTADVLQVASNGGNVWFGVRADGHLKTLGSLLTSASGVSSLSKVLRVYDEAGTVYYVPMYTAYS